MMSGLEWLENSDDLHERWSHGWSHVPGKQKPRNRKALFLEETATCRDDCGFKSYIGQLIYDLVTRRRILRTLSEADVHYKTQMLRMKSRQEHSCTSKSSSSSASKNLLWCLEKIISMSGPSIMHCPVSIFQGDCDSGTPLPTSVT